VKEQEFRAWLKAGGASSEAGLNTRVFAVRKIEENLASLGSPHANLETAWHADRFKQLRSKLSELRQNFVQKGTDYRILMPDSENPSNRLLSWRSWLVQYGKFLGGEPRGERNADRIRQHVLERYIEVARAREAETIDVSVRDVERELGLHQQWRNICQALKGGKFLDIADVRAPEQIGADDSPATVFKFYLGEAADYDTAPFLLFDVAGAEYRPVQNKNRNTGRTAYRVKPPGASARTDEAIEVDSIAQVAHAMLVEGRPARVRPVAGGIDNYLAYGKQKLVRYRLDPAIARSIGVEPQGTILQPTETRIELDRHMTQATNLILYGPPGTGKTYVTAMEAVRLCGEFVPDDREKLMAKYRQLSDAGRIEFITFHQSVSYDDFVEGLRPTQAAGEGEVGFRLKPEQGVFRRIARRAETSTGSGKFQFSMDGRKIFKMSIGEAANPDESYLFEEAIAGGFTLLGFEDIDWSDTRFTERGEIIEEVRAKGTQEGEPTGMSGRVQMPFIFRNWVKPGDIVVVSKGNSLFRAIGEVTGDYQFVPRTEPGYSHRRSVRWLWIDRGGVSVSEIYARDFMMKSIYQLTDADLNLRALERYIGSQQDTSDGAPEPFVLIIDEINRANISKVFGELITLLEPDKRIGQPNELRVRLPYSGEIFGVPSNLHILGTMNTADRSIALLDTALRRRFDFRELMPDPARLNVVDGIDLPKLLSTINERIEYLFDREHQIGHAYFVNCQSKKEVDATMRYKVIPLLAEYFFEDWSKIAVVLGDWSEGNGNHEGQFLDRKRLNPPSKMESEDSTPRFRWSVRDDFSYDDFRAI
jgi:5-methylcytosine-specific restriction protein B